MSRIGCAVIRCSGDGANEICGQAFYTMADENKVPILQSSSFDEVCVRAWRPINVQVDTRALYIIVLRCDGHELEGSPPHLVYVCTKAYHQHDEDSLQLLDAPFNIQNEQGGKKYRDEVNASIANLTGCVGEQNVEHVVLIDLAQRLRTGQRARVRLHSCARYHRSAVPELQSRSGGQSRPGKEWGVLSACTV